jgi:hypothetical protein
VRGDPTSVVGLATDIQDVGDAGGHPFRQLVCGACRVEVTGDGDPVGGPAQGPPPSGGILGSSLRVVAEGLQRPGNPDGVRVIRAETMGGRWR